MNKQLSEDKNWQILADQITHGVKCQECEVLIGGVSIRVSKMWQTSAAARRLASTVARSQVKVS